MAHGERSTEGGGERVATDLLDRAQEVSRGLGRDDLVLALEHERQRLASNLCRVFVIGEFKQGKSSLVNALLNLRVCATDPTAVTSLPTMVGYGPELSATAFVRDEGTAQEAEELISVDRLAEVTTTGPLSLEKTERRFQGVRVLAPRQLLRDGIELVDTPGVGGGLASNRAAITLQALGAADAAVFVSDAGAELTHSELEFLQLVADFCPLVICVLSKVDFYPRWREILGANASHLSRAGIEMEIIPTSSHLRLRGLATGDRDMVADSGFPLLSRRLREAMGHAAGPRRAAAAAKALTVLRQVRSQVLTERDSLTAGGSAQATIQKAEAKVAVATRLMSGQGWQRAISDGISRMASDIDFDLDARMREVQQQARDKINEADPARDWGDFGPWLQHATNEAIVEHMRLIRNKTDDLTDTVAQAFGASAWELGLDISPAEFTHAVTAPVLPEVTIDRGTRLQSTMVVARSGSTGVIVTQAVGLVLGLGIPFLLPVGTVLATLMAGASWRAARASQLKALRAEADRAVSAFVAEVRPVARKNSHDSVLDIDRMLRDVFGRTAAELHQTAVRNLRTTQERTTADAHHAATRIASIESQLADLDALERNAAEVVESFTPGRPPRSGASKEREP